MGILQLELICLYEFHFFIRRHFRYFLTFLAIYGSSIFQWRDTRIIRTGYCLLQHLDDVLDGDRIIAENPTQYAEKILHQMETGDYKNSSRISILAEYVSRFINSLPQEKKYLQSDLNSLIRLLIFDRERMDNKLLLPEKRLADHHYKTFYYSLELTLALSGSAISAKEVDDLLKEFCWCSPMRDLKEDIDKGLINIPSELIENMYPLDYDKMIQVPEIKNWAKSEYAQALERIDSFEKKLPAFKNRKGFGILKTFHKALKKYSRIYPKKYPEVFI